jgi:hypothetical protein
MIVDYWAHAHVEDPKLRETLATTDDFEAEVARMEAEIAAQMGEELLDPLSGEEETPPDGPVAVTPTVSVEPDPDGDPGEEWETVADERYG